MPEQSAQKSLLSQISSSKRLTLTYIVLFIWVALAVFGILIDTDLYALAVYFASGLPLILGYLWAETSRPASMRDAAEIVKGIGRNNQSGYNQSGYNQSGYNQSGYNQSGYNSYNNKSNAGLNITSIYSNDASIELKVNDNQLSTLLNIGYIDKSSDKYIFDKNYTEQIKSLINDNTQDPTI